MNVWRLLEHATRARPAALAVVDGERRLSWREVHARAAHLARFLREQGIEPGDRVAVLAWNGVEFLETTFAAAGAGAVLCPLNVRLAPAELRAVLDDTQPRWLIADRELVERATAEGYPWEGVLCIGEGAAGGGQLDYEATLAAKAAEGALFRPVEVEGPATCHLYSTSGTTGEPKGVPLTHDNVCVHALCAATELELTERDVWGHIAPMFHLADAWATLAMTAVGGVHVMLRRFDARAVIELLQREGITVTNLIPTMLARVVHASELDGADVSTLRAVLSGGAPIAPALVRDTLERLGCEYVQTYGMTETSPFLTLGLLTPEMRSWAPERRLEQLSKTGRPMLGVELEVIGEDGGPVARDDRTVGEIRVRGATVTPGYRNRPEANREAFADGWLRTGDLAVVDEHGFVTIVDRSKDVILSGGETVYSAEVEKALVEHPAVLETAVFGIEDQDWGEIVVAAVVFKEGCEASVDELQRHCRERLAGYKVPRTLRVMRDLPRTGSGKIAKRALREEPR